MIPEKWTSWTTEQAEAQLKFNQWNEMKNAVILDTETTGLYGAEIVEIAVIDTSGKTLLNTLVKPKDSISAGATEIHGITDEMVAEAPTWLEVWDRLYPILKEKKILIYNAEFDVRVMQDSFWKWEDELGYERVEELCEAVVEELDCDCVMKTYAQLVGSPKWLKLQEAAGREIAHRALNDCLATLEVVKKSHNPEFTDLDYYRIDVYEKYKNAEEALDWVMEQMEVIIRKYRYFHRNRRKYQEILLDDQKLKEYAQSQKEVAATSDPFEDDGKPLDNSDLDDLPF